MVFVGIIPSARWFHRTVTKKWTVISVVSGYATATTTPGIEGYRNQRAFVWLAVRNA